MPLIKKLYAGKGESVVNANSPSIMDSGPYRFYCRWFYPLERALCRLRPNLLGFQFVALCHKK